MKTAEEILDECSASIKKLGKSDEESED